jgi:hypothetical protein
MGIPRGDRRHIIWLAAFIGFAIYTANFGKYNETYSALGAIVVVMLWLYIGAYAVIAGAELNGSSSIRPPTTPPRADPSPWGPAMPTWPTRSARPPRRSRHRDPNGAACSPDYGTAPAGPDATLWMPTLLIRVGELRSALETHMQLEEEVVYPAMKPVTGRSRSKRPRLSMSWRVVRWQRC